MNPLTLPTTYLGLENMTLYDTFNLEASFPILCKQPHPS